MLVPTVGKVQKVHFGLCHGFLAPRMVAPACDSSLTKSAAVGFLLTSARSARRRCRARAGRRVELLVDGDSNSVGHMQKAIEILEKEGRRVHVTVFGPPEGRRSSTEWKQFLQSKNVVFQPVARGQDEKREANDEAIDAEIQSRARAKDVDCIALLSTDTGFLSSLQHCSLFGTETVLLIPDIKFEAIRFYEANRVRVQRIPTERNLTRVRARLRADGSGAVKLSKPYTAIENESRAAAVMSFLQDQGYYNHGACMYLIQSIAKFWFANDLGTLTVFPFQLATIAMSTAIESASSTQSWQAWGTQLAFFLPASNPGPRSADTSSRFGSRLARSVYRGGGPFILKDSSNLTRKALMKLGYMDYQLNTDLSEAMLCFVNRSENKNLLRKLGLLPAEGASNMEVDCILRQAFLSNGTPGQWRVGPRSSKEVQQVLAAANVLPKGPTTQKELFAAMGVYARRHGLPEMRTFNGRAWRILRFLDRSPTTRGVIEIAGS